MKKGLVLLTVLLLSLSFSIPTMAKKKHMDQVTASAMVLANLSQQGLVQIVPTDQTTFMFVEPLFWKGLTHVKKLALVNAGITVTRTEKQPPLFVIVQDMTSKATLARGFLDKGNIEILK